jgi:hypothetical protein
MHRNVGPLALCAWALACGSGTGGQTDTAAGAGGNPATGVPGTAWTGNPTDTDTTSTGCGNEVRWWWPDGEEAREVYHRATLEVLATDWEAAIIWLNDHYGENVAGFVQVQGARTMLTPWSPLQPGHTYDALYDYTCGSIPFEFTTSELGLPLEDPASVVGGAFTLWLDDVRWADPQLIGGELATTGRRSVMLEFTDLETDRATVRMGWGTGASQDRCAPTADFEVMLTEPYIALELGHITGTLAAPLLSAELGLTVSPDGTWAEGILTGKLDTQDLGEIDDPETGPRPPCEVLASAAVYCEECPTGPFTCVDARAHGLTGPRTGVVLEARSEGDILADPGCN